MREGERGRRKTTTKRLTRKGRKNNEKRKTTKRTKGNAGPTSMSEAAPAGTSTNKLVSSSIRYRKTTT